MGLFFFYIVCPVRAKFFRGVSSFGPFVLFFAAVNFYFFAASLVWIWFTSILLLRIQFTSIFLLQVRFGSGLRTFLLLVRFG